MDAEFLQSHLPQSIEAVFYIRGSSSAAQGYARRVHEDMLGYFGMSREKFPLLVLDPETASDAPFDKTF